MAPEGAFDKNQVMDTDYPFSTGRLESEGEIRIIPHFGSTGMASMQRVFANNPPVSETVADVIGVEELSEFGEPAKAMILNGLTQKGTIYRGSFAQYLEDD